MTKKELEEKLAAKERELAGLNDAYETMLSTVRDKQERIDFYKAELAKKDRQLDEVVAAAKQEVKVHKDIIDYLLALYQVRDPRVQKWKMGDQEISVRFAFSDDAVAMPHGDGPKIWSDR